MSEELLSTAVDAAKAAGDVLLGFFRQPHLKPRLKAEHDYVTAADEAAEATILSLIRDRHPTHRILSEEGGGDSSADSPPAGADEPEWIIDPLDGTSNFMQGLPIFAVSIACRLGADLEVGVVFDPFAGNLFSARRGAGASWNERRLDVSQRPGLDDAFVATGYPFRAQHEIDAYLTIFRAVFERVRSIRRCGAAALDLAYTAAGIYDGFFELALSPWDIAAGALLIEEAGGRVTSLDGGPVDFADGNLLAGGPNVHAELVEVVAGLGNLDRI